MKILIDGRLYGLENAGLGRYVINLVSELAKSDKENRYSILLRKKYFDSLKLPKSWKRVLADFKHYTVAEQRNLISIIKKEKPDVVHFPHFNVPIFYRGKYIVTIHDLLMHQQKGLAATTLIAPLYFLKRLAYKTVFRSAVLGAFKIIVPSSAVKKEVVNYYHLNPDQVEVIYEGFDEKIYLDGNAVKILSKYNLDSPYFLYVGNAYPHKNLGRVIEAIKLLNTKSNQKHFLAIASARNIFTQRLQKTVKTLKAEQLVKLLGFVPDEDLGILYKNSTAFVFPSLSEGFGLPGLEAMNAGVSVLASDIPVFREVYQDNVTYFDPYDANSIVKAMEELIRQDKFQRIDRIEKARKFAKRYSWAKMARETLDTYQGLR